MTTLTPEDRARLRDLTSQATPGPWRVYEETYEGMILAVGADEETVYATDADMALMGAARTAIPALLDALAVADDLRAEAWDEGYQQGVSDQRTADECQVGVGLGPDIWAQPNRTNPYKETR